MRNQTLLVVVEGHPGGSWYGEFVGMDRHDNGQKMFRVGCSDGSYNLVFEHEVAKIVVACGICGELPTARNGTVILSGPCGKHAKPVEQAITPVELQSFETWD